jgi:hypothetical protein
MTGASSSNIYVIAGIISVIFFIIKFIEMRFVDKESKPLKYLFRDTLLVYFSVLAGSFIVDQLKPVMDDNVVKLSTPAVFTDNPGF